MTAPKQVNWLVTGGCGFIGRSLIASLQKDGAEIHVRVLDDLSVGSKTDLEQSCGEFVEGELDWGHQLQLVQGDIRSESDCNSAVAGADVVVHLAANTGVAPSVTDPLGDCRSNVIGTLNVLEASRTTQVRRFILASSGAPLGVQVPPLHEELAPRPASPYGASKLAAEGYCSAYFHCFGLETVALRFGNVYGPGSSKKSSVVAKFIKEAIAGEPWEIYGDGSQTRDFIFIGDLVEAIRAAAATAAIGGEVFQIATSREVTVGEIAKMLGDALASAGVQRPKIETGPRRRGDVMRNFSDTTKAQEQLGWSATTELSYGLSVTVTALLTSHHDAV